MYIGEIQVASIVYVHVLVYCLLFSFPLFSVPLFKGLFPCY